LGGGVGSVNEEPESGRTGPADRGERPPSIKDVADAAGVSTATVSHVVNETRPVREETRKRVLAAIDQLGYRRSLVARGLRRQRSDAIGFVLPDLHGSFFPNVVRGAEGRLFKEDYMYFLAHTADDTDREAAYLQRLGGWAVDGLLYAPALGASGADHQLLNQVRATVFIDRRPELVGFDSGEFPSVLVDNDRASYEAVEQLISEGFRRIAIVSPGAAVGPIADRAEGARACLRDAGLPCIEAPFVSAGEEAGALQTRQLLGSRDRPDAIFSTTNRAGFGVMRELHERNVRVPEDVGLVVFDDSEWSEMAGVTAIRTNPRELGATAADMLVQLLGGGRPVVSEIVVPARLMRRNSTSRAAQA